MTMFQNCAFLCKNHANLNKYIYFLNTWLFGLCRGINFHLKFLHSTVKINFKSYTKFEVLEQFEGRTL